MKKKPYLFLLFLALSISACKKEAKAPSIGDVVSSEEKIVLGQYTTLSASVTDADTKAEELKYSWTGTDGFRSSIAKPDWSPRAAGSQTISLTVTDGEKSVTKDITFQIFDADFRRALWGNSSAQIKKYESKAGNSLLTSSTTLLAYEAGNSTTVDLYALTNDLVTSGATLYMKSYTDNEQYRYDYNNIINILKIKFGNYESSKIFYRTEEIKNRLTGRPELWANAIVAGDARLETIWYKGNNIISHQLFKSSTSTTIILGTYYSKKTEGSTTSILSDSFNRSITTESLDHLHQRIITK